MTPQAFRCPFCGFTALVKDGCRYCNPNGKEDEPRENEEMEREHVQEGTADSQVTPAAPDCSGQGILTLDGGRA